MMDSDPKFTVFILGNTSSLLFLRLYLFTRSLKISFIKEEFSRSLKIYSLSEDLIHKRN